MSTCVSHGNMWERSSVCREKGTHRSTEAVVDMVCCRTGKEASVLGASESVVGNEDREGAERARPFGIGTCRLL